MYLLKIFNDKIAGLAGSYKTELIDIHKHFLGHGVYAKDPKNPHYNPDDPTLWYENIIEPNWRGAHEIRHLFWERITLASRS